MSLLEHIRTSSRGASTDNPAVTSPPPVPEPVLAPPPSNPATEASPRAIRIVRNDALNDLKARVHEQLIHDLDPEQLVGDLSFTSPARRAVEQAAEEAITIADGAVGR